MFHLHRFTFCLFALCAAAPAIAQVRTDTTIALPEATITADRYRNSNAASLTRITSIVVDNANPQQSRSVADLLDTSTGIYVRRYGPSGSAGIAFRGTDPNQTEILLDGLRITDPQSGQVDLSLIPVVLLQSVEILHGPGSSSEYSGGLGGTVKLHTLPADQTGRGRLRASSGAFGSRNMSALANGGSGGLSGLIAVEYTREDGDFPYVNNALEPPETTRRTGADMEASSIFGKAGVAGSAHRATVSAWINRVERGLPGPGNASPVPSRQEDEHLRTWINTNHMFPAVVVSTDWSIQTSELRYTNEDAATDDRTRTTSLEARADANIPVGRAGILQTGADWVRHTSAGVEENRLAAFGSVAGEIPVLLLEASVRAETWSTQSGTRSQLVPRAGVNIKRFLHHTLRLKMSAGRSWTVPSLIDRYWVPGGNPNLQPETGWSGDAGLHFGSGRVELEITGFSATLNDRIVWIPSLVGSGVQVWKATNVGKVNTYGLETSAAVEATLRDVAVVKGGLAVAYTEARDRSDRAAASYGHQVKYTPRTVVHASAGMEVGRFELGMTGHLVGKRYITTDETSSLPSYVVMGGRASYEIGVGPLSATLSFTAENLLDQSYSTIRFYPMPPRHFGFGLNLEWRNPHDRSRGRKG